MLQILSLLVDYHFWYQITNWFPFLNFWTKMDINKCTISTASLVDYHFYSMTSWLPLFDIKALVDYRVWISEPKFSKEPSVCHRVLLIFMTWNAQCVHNYHKSSNALFEVLWVPYLKCYEYLIWSVILFHNLMHFLMIFICR